MAPPAATHARARRGWYRDPRRPSNRLGRRPARRDQVSSRALMANATPIPASWDGRSARPGAEWSHDHRPRHHYHRDRPRDPPDLDLPARWATRRDHLQPVRGQGRRAVALPHRHPPAFPNRERRCGYRRGSDVHPLDQLGQRLATRRVRLTQRVGVTCPVSLGDPWRSGMLPLPLRHGHPSSPAHWPTGRSIDIGGHLLQWIDTPHVPGPWEAGVLFDVTTKPCSAGTCSPAPVRQRPRLPMASPTRPSPTTS